MSKPKVSEMINDLSPEDMADVLELIARKSKGKESRKRKQQRKNKQKRIIIPDEEPEPEPQPRPTTRRTIRRRSADEFDVHEHRKMRSKGRKRGVQARCEPLGTGPRNNMFDKMGARNAHKKDVKIDQALSGSNEITERRDPIEYVEIHCKRCKRLFDALPHELYSDPEEGLTYICDDCSTQKAPEG